MLFVVFLLGVGVGKHLEAYPEMYSGGFTEMVRGRLSWLSPKKEEPPRPDLDARTDPAAQEETFDLTFYEKLGEKKDKNRPVSGEKIDDNPANKKAAVPETTGKAELDSHKAELNFHQAELNFHQAELDSHKAELNSHQAELNSHQAELDFHKAELDSHQAEPNLRPKGAATDGGSAGRNSAKAGAEYRVSVSPEGPSEAGRAAKKGVFEVQAAAYRDARQAEAMVRKLKQLGFAPRIVPKEIPNKGKWFRVIAGDFASRKEAQDASLQIAGKITHIKCIIRHNEGNGT